MNKQQNKQTAIYCRLSRDDETGVQQDVARRTPKSGTDAAYQSVRQDSMSIQNQKTLLSQYAANNGFTDYTFYVDDGFSGTSFERPDFKRMIKDIEAGKIGTVIVKDLSRLGREYLQTGYYTEIFFPQNDVRFIAVNDGVDSVNGNNEFAPFKNIINEWYAKDCSRKIISALHTKAKNGGIIMGQAPYGYDKAKDNVHRLVPNENAWVVKLMFQLALEGKSAYLIAKELEQRKVMIPKAEQMIRRGLQDSPDFPKHKYVWGKRSIHKILTNPVYTGDLVCLRRLRKNFKTKQSVEVPKEEQVIIPNTHEAFVSHEDFETIQKRLETKQRAYDVNPDNIFRGLVVCSDCGLRMAYSRTKSKNIKGYYRCQSHIRYKRSENLVCKNSHHITIEQITEVVLHDIQRHVRLASEDIEAYAEHLEKLSECEKNSESALCRQKSDKAKKRLAEIDMILQKMYEDKVFGVISDERYATMSKKLEDEQTELKRLISESAALIEEHEKKTKNIGDFIELISKYTDITELDYDIVHMLIDKIVVFGREKSGKETMQRIEIYYRFVGNISDNTLNCNR